QAEDGIRDRNVTAVQTCALPIYELAGVPLPTTQRACEPGNVEHGGFGSMESRETPACQRRDAPAAATRLATPRWMQIFSLQPECPASETDRDGKRAFNIRAASLSFAVLLPILLISRLA